jgi:hypothetical protein
MMRREVVVKYVVHGGWLAGGNRLSRDPPPLILKLLLEVSLYLTQSQHVTRSTIKRPFPPPGFGS